MTSHLSNKTEYVKVIQSKLQPKFKLPENMDGWIFYDASKVFWATVPSSVYNFAYRIENDVSIGYKTKDSFSSPNEGIVRNKEKKEGVVTIALPETYLIESVFDIAKKRSSIPHYAIYPGKLLAEKRI